MALVKRTVNRGRILMPKLRLLADAWIAEGGNLPRAMARLGMPMDKADPNTVRRGYRYLAMARQHGLIGARVETSPHAMDAAETLALLTQIARGETPEQERLLRLGHVADLSKYIQTISLPGDEEGKVVQVLGLDIAGLQRDGLGHMIRSVEPDKVTMRDPVPPNEASLKARATAATQLSRIHGMEKAPPAGNERIREIRERVLVVLTDKRSRRQLDALASRGLGNARVIEVEAER